MTEQALTCRIPTDGANAPRSTTIGVEGLPLIARGEVEDRRSFRAYACPTKDAPATPDRVEPDRTFVRKVHASGRLTMPDGVRVPFWGFYDPDDPGGARPFPSPTIRVREGEVVHTVLKAAKRRHTIHHHGIEPLPVNDGVGHTSFEVSGTYTYQWRPAAPGLFFYHCHKNTALHFEMGMYGALIVDPPEGEGLVPFGRRLLAYDHEVLWVADDVDPDWHHLNHEEGIDCDGFTSGHSLNRFHPRYFLLSGIADPDCREHPDVAVEMRRGETLLMRILNASYTVQHWTLGVDATVVILDGHALGEHADRGRYAEHLDVPAGRTWAVSVGQRWELLARPTRAGRFPVRVDFIDWVTRDALGTARTTIQVR
jgi:FtsP/CotA-like multicopper oxidase with cupredoxin domain